MLTYFSLLGEDGDGEDEGEEKKKKKKKSKNKKSAEDDDYNATGDEDDGSSSSSDDDSDIQEVKGTKRPASPDLPQLKKPNENYFESTLGKFVYDVGMNLVQEAVQHDLLKQQQKKAKKDKSAAVMHAIMSLKKNIEQSKEKNVAFHHELKKCRFCSYKTESQLALDLHMETPHMKHGFYRCNFCRFETAQVQEVLAHMMTEHNVRARLERAPAVHQCPQCPFEDNMKGKLTRHKVGCDKRFRPERNQERPHDWEPPAKIPKPPAHAAAMAGGHHRRPMMSQNFAGVRCAMAQFNQQSRNVYQGMPSLQFGPRGAAAGRGGRLPLFNTRSPMTFNRNNMQGMQGRQNLLQNLGANSSVTIQVCPIDFYILNSMMLWIKVVYM